MRARVLLVEDEVNMVRTLRAILGRRGLEVDAAGDGEEALARLAAGDYDVVITDLNMPVLDGMGLLRAARERPAPSNPAFIVLTGYGTIPSAVEAMKLGAADYLIKPCNPEELILTLEKVLEVRALHREVEHLKREVHELKHLGELVGQSPAMREVYRLIEAVSQNKSNVLISGESGTGKELVARTIHRRGPLADRPFLALNCGGLSETLLDSQLFGHRRGAFTGAIADHEGVFRAADGGTLFLDEVAELPLPLQVKFLRAVQEKEVTPLGSTRPVPVDVRILAATHHDLEADVQQGTFRADLYYRLNVVAIRIPPLRERREDIPLLIEHLIAEYSRIYKVEPKRLSAEASARLLAYDWPGNVRELQNAIERAFALSTSSTIGIGDLPERIAGGAPGQESSGGPDEAVALAEAERRAISAALARAGGNKNEAARILRIDRQRLYRKIEKYGLG